MDVCINLRNYLRFLSETFKLEICINDFYGFMRIDPSISEIFQEFLIHRNPYCMRIKSNRILWDRCLRMKKSLHHKAERKKSIFYGMCYCGVEEYVIPILHQGRVIGVITIGEYNTNERITHYRLKKTAAFLNCDYKELTEVYEASTRRQKLPVEQIQSMLGIAADFLSDLYSKLAARDVRLNAAGRKSSVVENYILSHAIEYIRQNYFEPLTVESIAVVCHCSQSYISHIFKKNMLQNIRAYINSVRVEQAKEYLLNTRDPVSEIAMKVGFNDPNYFSNVFTRIAGTPPTAFKKSNN